MCDFHSILGVAIGDNFSIYHDPSNSHEEMRKNLPTTASVAPMARPTTTFEAEWNGEDKIPSDTRLIRNIGECPDRLVKKIRDHYTKLKEALETGKHIQPGGYFGDVAKYEDVWSAAMRKGHALDFSEVVEFTGSVDVRQGATFTAPKLTKAGSVDVREGATFTAPELTEVAGSVYVCEGATFTAPVLAKAGYVDVCEGATLTAPVLAKAGSVYVCEGATFTAPELKR